MPVFRIQHGFSLMEVMIAVFLSTLLMSGIIQLLGGSVSVYRLQLSQGQLEESGRYARDVLTSHISQAGYQPAPWQDQPELPALTDETLDGGLQPGDQLGDGQPAFHLLQTRFKVNANNNLAITCRYGPNASSLTTQINNYGLVEDVESMQVLYAEDRDDDKIADSWVTGQTWQQESNIRAIKIALLLSTRQPFDQPASEQITLLNETLSTPADGHLRTVSLLTSAIRGRLK